MLDWGLTLCVGIVFLIVYLGMGVVAFFTVLLAIGIGLRAVYDWIVTVAPLIDPGPIVEIVIPASVKAGLTTVAKFPIGVATVLLVGTILLLPVVFALSVYYVFLGVVPRTFSIYREYAADRGAALLTGNPAAVANAPNRPTDDLRQPTDIRALCLIPDGISDDAHVGPTREWIAENCPSIDDRVTRLRQITRTLEDQ